MSEMLSQFKSYYPEYAKYSDEEIVMFVSLFRKEEIDITNWIRDRINYYNSRKK